MQLSCFPNACRAEAMQAWVKVDVAPLGTGTARYMRVSMEW